MKSSDAQYLAEAYELIKIRQFLINEGYSNVEIDQLIAEGKIWDTVKSVGKKAGRYAAIGAAAAGIMGGAQSAKAADLNPDMFNVQKIEASAKQKVNAELKGVEETVDNILQQKGIELNKSDRAVVLMKMNKLKDPSKIQQALDLLKPGMSGTQIGMTLMNAGY